MSATASAKVVLAVGCGVPVTMIVELPPGVDVVVVIVSILELPVGEVGVIVVGLNEQEAAGGRDDETHDRVTGWPVRVEGVGIMVLLPERPLIAVMGPELASECCIWTTAPVMHSERVRIPRTRRPLPWRVPG